MFDFSQLISTERPVLRSKQPLAEKPAFLLKGETGLRECLNFSTLLACFLPRNAFGLHWNEFRKLNGRIRPFTGRDLDHTGWVLWIRGFEVADRYWKAPFTDASNEFFRAVTFAIDQEYRKDVGEVAISDDAISELEAISKDRNRSEFFGPIRRSLGRSNYVTFLHNILKVAAGIFEPKAQSKSTDASVANELIEIFQKAIGDHEDRKLSGLDAVLVNFSISALEFEEVLGQLSKQLMQFRDAQIIEFFTEEELKAGRNETNILFGQFYTIANALVIKPRALELLQRLLDGLTAKQHALMIFYLAFCTPHSQSLCRTAEFLSNGRFGKSSAIKN